MTWPKRRKLRARRGKAHERVIQLARQAETGTQIMLLFGPAVSAMCGDSAQPSDLARCRAHQRSTRKSPSSRVSWSPIPRSGRNSSRADRRADVGFGPGPESSAGRDRHGDDRAARQHARMVAKRSLATSPIWRDGCLLPMTSPTPPVSTAAKQQHQNDDDEDQFHKKSPWLL